MTPTARTDKLNAIYAKLNVTDKVGSAEVLEITRPEREGGRGKCCGAAASQVAQVRLSRPTNPVRRSFFGEPEVSIRA